MSRKSVMNVKGGKLNLNPTVVLEKLSDEEVLRKTTPVKFSQSEEELNVSGTSEKGIEVIRVWSTSDVEGKQDPPQKVQEVEATKPQKKSIEEDLSKTTSSAVTGKSARKSIAKPVGEARVQQRVSRSSSVDVGKSVGEVTDKESVAHARSTVTEELLTQISLSAPVADVEKVVQALSPDKSTEKSEKTGERREKGLEKSEMLGEKSQKVGSSSTDVNMGSQRTAVMADSRNVSVLVPKLPLHISPQKSYNINDPSITPPKIKPRTPTAKEAMARKMVKKAKTRANGKGVALSLRRLMGDDGNPDTSSDFVETGKTFQPAIRKLRSRNVKKAAEKAAKEKANKPFSPDRERVSKPTSPDRTVTKGTDTDRTSDMPADVDSTEGKTCLTCKQTIFGTEESVKEHMKACLRQRFVSDKESARQAQLRHMPHPAEQGSLDLEVSDDESLAHHLQQREEDKLMEEQLTDAEFYFCQICGRDLTHLNTVRRTQHINRCIDAMETEKKLHAEENVKDVPDCPICGKVLESRAQRQSHLKRCAVQYGVTTVQLLDLVKKQEEENARRKKHPGHRLHHIPQLHRGIKRPHEGPAGTAGKRPRKPARPIASSRGPPAEGAPHREMDERAQVAMAMSMSLVEADQPREQPAVPAFPLGAKEIKRRKKAAKTDEVPALLLTSKEEREKSLAQKVAKIIAQGDPDSHPKTPSMKKSRVGRKYHTARKTMVKSPSTPAFLQKSPAAGISSTAAAAPSHSAAASSSTAESPPSSQERAPLWSMSKSIDKKKTDDFYVQQLSKQITPAKYVPVTPMRKAAKKALMTFKKKSESDTSESETPGSPRQKSVTSSQKARKTPTSPKAPSKRPKPTPPLTQKPTPSLTQRETATILAELAEEGCSTQEVQGVFTQSQAPSSPEPSGFVPDRSPPSPQKTPSSQPLPSAALSKLSEDFLGMVNSPKLSDLDLLCQNGIVLHAHRFVLVARCPVLSTMLEKSEKDKKDFAALDFSDHHVDAVLATLQYMYGGKFSLTDKVLTSDVLRLAQKLELRELEDRCHSFLNPTIISALAAASSPEFQEKELPELLDAMVGSPNPNLSQGSTNQSMDSQGFNDSELEDIALTQKQRLQPSKSSPSKNVSREPAVTKKPTQMVSPAGRGLSQAPERQESGPPASSVTFGDVVQATIEKNLKEPARFGPEMSQRPTRARQPPTASTEQSASGVGVRIPVEHSYSTSPKKTTHRSRRVPKTTVTPMTEGLATTVTPVTQPASVAPSLQGAATAVTPSTRGVGRTVTPSRRGVATAVTPSTHAMSTTVTSSTHAVPATLSPPSRLGVATTVAPATHTTSSAESFRTSARSPPHAAMTQDTRPGAREQSLIIQSQELSSKMGCEECEKLGVRVSADEAQMLIQGGPAATAMRQLILARQMPCPHGKFPSWGPSRLPPQAAPTWMPPTAREAAKSAPGRPGGHLLAGLRSRTPPSSPQRQTAIAAVVTTSTSRPTPTHPVHALSPHVPRAQTMAELARSPFGPGVPPTYPRPGGPRPDLRLPGSHLVRPPLPGLGMIPPSGRLPPASTLLPRTNILAQLREKPPSGHFPQQRYGPAGIVPEQYPPRRNLPNRTNTSISPGALPSSEGRPDSTRLSLEHLSQLRSSSPSSFLMLQTAQMLIPGNQYLTNRFPSQGGPQRPPATDSSPRLSVLAESRPPPHSSAGLAIVRIPSPLEKSQDRSGRHLSPPRSEVPDTAVSYVPSLSTPPSTVSAHRIPPRSSAGSTVSSASLNSSSADMFAVPDTPPSTGRPKRRGNRGRGRTPSESDHDTRSAAEALMFMSQRRDEPEGSEEEVSTPPGIPGTQVHSASSPRSVTVTSVSSASGSPMPRASPSTPGVLHASRFSSPQHSPRGGRYPLIRPQSWPSLVRREENTADCSILKTLLQRGVAAAIPQLYKDQAVPPHIQKQALKETHFKQPAKQQAKTVQDVRGDTQTHREVVVGRNSSGEVHGAIVVNQHNGERVMERESSEGLHDSRSDARDQGKRMEGEGQRREVHDGNFARQGQGELMSKETDDEPLSIASADNLRDSMLCKIIHPDSYSSVPGGKGTPVVVADRSQVERVYGRDLHAETLTRERVLTSECRPLVDERSFRQVEASGVAAVYVSGSSGGIVLSQTIPSGEEEGALGSDCDKVPSTSAGPATKRRRAKPKTPATTLPSSTPTAMSRQPNDTSSVFDTSSLLGARVEIVLNPRRGTAEIQEPELGKLRSIQEDNQGVSLVEKVAIPTDQGDVRVTRRSSQRIKQGTSKAAESESAKQKDGPQLTPSPSRRARMQRAPPGKRHACTQSPKKFWTDYLKAQLASGYAPSGPVGEAMMQTGAAVIQTPDLSVVKPARRGVVSPELGLTSPEMVGVTAVHHPKSSTPVSNHSQEGSTPRLSLDQKLKETETVSQATSPVLSAPRVVNEREMKLGCADSPQTGGANKGEQQRESSTPDSPLASRKLQESGQSLNNSFSSVGSESSGFTSRPAQLFVKDVQEGPAVIVQTQSDLLSPTIDFHEETIVPRSVTPTPPQSPLAAVRSRLSSTATPPASPAFGPTLEQAQGRVLAAEGDGRSKDTPVDVIELSDDDQQQEVDLQDAAKRKRITPDSESEAKKTKTDTTVESSTDGKDVDGAERVPNNSVADVSVENVEKIDLTLEDVGEAAVESRQGDCGTEHGCGSPDLSGPCQSSPVESTKEQSQGSQPSVVNDSFVDFFDDGGYMEVPFGGEEVECAADSSDDKVNLEGAATEATVSKEDQDIVHDLSLRLEPSPEKNYQTTSSVPLSPENASNVIEDFPDTQQESAECSKQDMAGAVEGIVEEESSADVGAVNDSMYDLEAYHDDYPWHNRSDSQLEDPVAAQGVVGGVAGGSDTGAGAVKSTPVQIHHKSKAPMVPITPMPDYPNMDTPELKKEVKKYGVRPLKKRLMVAKLTEIYQYTHQVESDSEEDHLSGRRTSSNNVGAQYSQVNTRQTVIHEVPRLGEVVETVPCTVPRLGEVVETVPCTDAGPAGSGADSDGSTDSNSEGEDYEEQSDDDDVTPSQQVDGASLKGQLLHWVQGNKELYEKILQYEPIDAENLQQTLKSAGIRCSKNQLLDFLDEQCITFILPSSREKRLKKPRRKRKKKTPPAADGVV